MRICIYLSAGKIDIAIIEATAITEEGGIVPITSIVERSAVEVIFGARFIGRMF